jgi:hypothetical protein
MEFVVKRPSRMQGQCFFRSWAGHATIFGQVQKKPDETIFLREGCPRPYLTSLEVRGGRGRDFNVPLIMQVIIQIEQWMI